MRTVTVVLAALACLQCLAAAEAPPPGPPAPPALAAPAAPRAKVEVEEDVYRYEPADNGAGPLWCFGSTCLARVGDAVLATGLETIAGAPPLNNCRWTLWRREAAGWRLAQKDPSGRTREPCPVVAFPDGRVLVSVNPTLTEPDARAGPARPEILEFAAADPQAAPKSILPGWEGEPPFTEHSYRSFAADGPRGELILFQNIGYTHAEWAFRDGAGRWAARGRLVWPWGAEYDKPGPIRVCYPTVALKDRAVHFCGVSDIVEPYAAWRAYKKELTGREWDYDFRRLFYAWSADITTGKFAEWVEIASRDKTCGWVMPRDLWVAPDGTAFILWTERAIDERLREKFFPGAKQRHALELAIVRGGKVTARRTLLESAEGAGGEEVGMARFHPTPDGRLLVFYYAGGRDREGKAVSENRLVELAADGSPGPATRVPLAPPFTNFFTATPRAGSAPSAVLDVLGECAGAEGTIRYARIRVE
ncbi:MAG: hypothetical protein IMZ66_10865 [Planctomycetes bacterium]|nr:hypothetical protein [Planctomycetota bacterium]